MLLSVMASGVAGYAVNAINNTEKEVTDTIEGMYESVGNLNENVSEIRGNLSSTNKVVAVNQKKMEQLDVLAMKIQDATAELGLLQIDVFTLREQNDQNKSLVTSFGEQLQGFGLQLKELTSKIMKKPKKVKKVRKHKVIRDDVTKVGGATVESIDSWGSSINVMLRNERGAWVAMNLGDTYKGWNLRKVDGNIAYFSKGSKRREITVEG